MTALSSSSPSLGSSSGGGGDLELSEKSRFLAQKRAGDGGGEGQEGGARTGCCRLPRGTRSKRARARPSRPAAA